MHFWNALFSGSAVLTTIFSNVTSSSRQLVTSKIPVPHVPNHVTLTLDRRIPTPEPLMVTITKPALAPPPPQHTLKQPDFNTKNETLRCYNSGQKIPRKDALKAIDRFCFRLAFDPSKPLKQGQGSQEYMYFQRDFWIPPFWSLLDFHTITSVLVKEGCEWNVDKGMCKRELRKIVDHCDTNSVKHKQGGRLETECLKWGFDPESTFIKENFGDG